MRNQNGITWVEMLFVIAVIGIVAAIFIPRLNQARDDAQGRADFQLYFGVKPPEGVLDSAQKSVLKPLIEKRMKEFSEITERDRSALTNIFKQPPALDAAQAQDRVNAVTKAEKTLEFSENQYQRARFAAQLYDLIEK